MGLKTLAEGARRGYPWVMKMILSLLVLAAALPVKAQVDVPRDQLDTLKGAMEGFRQRLAPAKIKSKAVDILFDRLAKDPESNFTKAATGPDGATEVLSITLNEVEGPADAGKMGDGPAGGVAVQDLVYRRYFTHMEAVSQKITPQKDGRTTIDEWRYVIGLDGSIAIVTHNVMVGKMKDAASLEVDKTNSKSYRMSPSDPSVQARWKKLQEQFLKMGRTYEA